MKRMNAVGAALVALVAFGVFAAAASAAPTFLLAEWLVDGAGVTTNVLSEAEGELEFLELNGGGLGVAVTWLCSGIFVGWVGPNGLDWSSELLNLNREAISLTELVGLSLEEPECTNVQNCPKPLVWPDGIPGETLAELMEDPGPPAETFFVDLLFNAGWEVECMGVVPFAELCSAAETAVQLTNEPAPFNDVHAEFSDAFQVLAGLKLANCTVGGNEKGEVGGLGFVSVPGKTLEVSSGP